MYASPDEVRAIRKSMKDLLSGSGDTWLYSTRSNDADRRPQQSFNNYRGNEDDNNDDPYNDNDDDDDDDNDNPTTTKWDPYANTIQFDSSWNRDKDIQTRMCSYSRGDVVIVCPMYSNNTCPSEFGRGCKVVPKPIPSLAR